MDEQQDEFDAYLRQFRPRAPGIRLEPVVVRRPLARRWLAAAAVVIASIGAYLVLPILRSPRGTDSEITPTSRAAFDDPASLVTLGWLTRAAIAAPDEFDAALLDASPRILPRVERPDSTLNVLAKD